MISERLGLSHSALFARCIKKGEQHRYMRFYAAMVLTDIVREVSAVQQHAEAVWLNRCVSG